ncbi:Uncharacterised protein [Serratia marcescens]|nr:hypothetical protein Q7S_25956 [Rahnella aquatilis HX2]CVB05893.1 Uncharacterised protein [Serratia marcescens]
MLNFDGYLEVTIFVHAIDDPVNNFIAFPIVSFYIARSINAILRCLHYWKFLAIFIKENPFIIIHIAPF